jgi:hypothetical protein
MAERGKIWRILLALLSNPSWNTSIQTTPELKRIYAPSLSNMNNSQMRN